MIVNLTPNQKKVFCALEAHPFASDRRLAEVLHMKRGTVQLARQHLIAQRLFSMHLLPHHERLPLAYIGLKYGDYGKIKPIDYQQRMALMTTEMKIQETVFSLSSPYRGVSLFYGKDLYPLQEQLEQWNALFKSIDTSIVVNDFLFAPQMIRGYKILEVNDLLSRVLGIPSLPNKIMFHKILPEKIPHHHQQHLSRTRHLRAKERQFLIAWLGNPTASHDLLSQETGLSRSAIGAMKQRFLRENIVRNVFFPSWPMLGITLGIFFHLQVSFLDAAFLEDLCQRPEVIFLLASSSHLFVLALFRDYDEYEGSSLNRSLKAQRSIKEPREILFPLRETKIFIDGASVVEKVL